MLETEIKKLTEALTANTEALLARQGGNNALVHPATPQTGQNLAAAIPPAQQAIVPANTAITPPPAQTPAGPTVAPPGPAASQQIEPPAGPAPTGPQMDHKTAQGELGAIVQALGDGAPVQAIMQQYGSARLNEIPVENLFALVQSCKALLQP